MSTLAAAAVETAETAVAVSIHQRVPFTKARRLERAGISLTVVVLILRIGAVLSRRVTMSAKPETKFARADMAAGLIAAAHILVSLMMTHITQRGVIKIKVRQQILMAVLAALVDEAQGTIRLFKVDQAAQMAAPTPAAGDRAALAAALAQTAQMAILAQMETAQTVLVAEAANRLESI